MGHILKKDWLAIILGLLFIVLSFFVNFYQNDDWVYSVNVGTFLRGDFSLNWYVGPTFFAQGLLGALFAFFFGLGSLPVLTGIVTAVNVLLLNKYLKNKFGFGNLTTALILIILVFNPLFLYSSIGFMTEQYFLLILVLAQFIVDKFIETRSLKYFVALVAITFVGILIRQVTLTIPLALAVYLFYKKDFKHGALSFAWFAALYFYLENIFPKTQRMYETALRLHHYESFDYMFALVAGSIAIMVAFSLPLVAVHIKNFVIENKNKKSILLLTVTVVAVLHIFASTNFKPDIISWGEFPYFENTFERTGLYPRGIHGTKYQFIGNFKLYKYWDDISWWLGGGLIAAVLFKYRVTSSSQALPPRVNYYFCFICIYLTMLIATETFFDRYILPMFVMFVFYLLSLKPAIKRLDTIYFGAFAIFLIFFGYNLVMDFVLANRYAWSISNKIVNVEMVEPNKIHGTNAWKLLYRNETRDYKYLISYDSAKVNSEIQDLYNEYDSYTVKYPGNIFINPTIYVYERKTQ